MEIPTESRVKPDSHGERDGLITWCKWNAILIRNSSGLLFLWLYMSSVSQFQQRAMKIVKHLMMFMLKNVRIFDVSLADISLSPSLKARNSWQVKILSLTTLSNIRQTEFAFLNESFVQWGYMPVLSFSVVSVPVCLVSAFLACIVLTFSLQALAIEDLFYV